MMTRRQWKAAGWLLVALVAVAAGGHELQELFSEPQGIVTALQRQVVSGKDSGLEITGWLTQNRAIRGSVLSVWYRLTNLTAAPIPSLRLSIYAPAFSPPTLGGHRPASFPVFSDNSSDLAVPGNRLWGLGPGASRTIRVDMVASGGSGDYMLTSCFTWHGAGGVEAATLDLGPMRVRSARLELIAAWKDFAAPVIAPLSVLLIGWLFQTRLQKFVQERQASAVMLPSSHQTNTKTYLPLLSAISTFEGELPKLKACHATSDQHPALLFFLISVRIMRDVDANGGFYLADREGENLAAACWNAFRESFLEHLAPFEEFSSIVDAVDPQDSVSSFTRKLSYTLLDQAVTEQGRKLKAWADGEQAHLFKLLSLFQLVFWFEINRIYDFWYGGPGEFPFEDFGKLVKELQEKGALQNPALVKTLRKYPNSFQRFRDRRKLRSCLCSLQVEKKPLPGAA